MFRVREMFSTFQGEGSRAGQPAVFVRLSGCNLWTGHEKDRDASKFDCGGWCDTDFAGGDPYECDALVEAVAELAAGMSTVLIVLTGGEPMLQLGHADGRGVDLVASMRRRGWVVAVETNGTRPVPRELAPLLSHVTVSPKAARVDGAASPGTDHLRSFAAQDLKIVVPCPMPIDALVKLYPRAELFFQPRDLGGGDSGATYLQEALRLARDHGGRVSLQTHKFAGMP